MQLWRRGNCFPVREGSQLGCLKGNKVIFLFFLTLRMEANTCYTKKTSPVISLLCLKPAASEFTPNKSQSPYFGT